MSQPKPEFLHLRAPVGRKYSVPFLQGMLDRMTVSFYKYGPLKEGYPRRLDALESLKLRLVRYEDTGNTEFLIDAANFAMIESMRPRHSKSPFDSGLPVVVLNHEPQLIGLRTLAPESEYSERFLQAMLDHAPQRQSRDSIKRLRARLSNYVTRGDTQLLVEVANLAMTEFMRPEHPNAHFEATDSSGSPGRVTMTGRVVRSEKNDRLMEVFEPAEDLQR